MNMTKHEIFSRRQLLKSAGAFGLGAALGRFAPAYAGTTGQAQSPALSGNVIDLEIDDLPFKVNGRTGSAIALNGTVPGPLLRLREGQEAVIRVNNRLKETSSIHWHGILLPPAMDGVPGVSFAGIQPQSVFTYRFPVTQSGTYWAHSHSGGQELLGLYFPLIIDPVEPEPFQYDRDYVVMFSDWSFESPEAIISRLKKRSGYYNYDRRTMADFFRDAGRNGFSATFKERWDWSKMRMDPTDFADVTGYTYTYLMNGLTPEANWTGLFKPGERVRLRFIDAGAMTYFDVRIPGLRMTVVQAHGQNVKPVEVDEFRIGPGETYDVIVQPEDRAYTVFSEAMDRSGYTRGTLAPRAGMTAEVPPRRPRPLRTMADMGMSEMEGMGGAKATEGMKGMKGMEGAKATEGMKGMDMGAAGKKAEKMPGMDMAGHDMQGMDAAEKSRQRISAQRQAAIDAARKGQDMGGMKMDAKMGGMKMGGTGGPAALKGPSLPGSPPVMHGPDTHGAGNSSVAMSEINRLDDPGSGFEGVEGKILVYADLQSVTPFYDQREPEREIELHITGNMERYSWSFDGKKYSEAKQPIAFRYGERLRLILVNDTMMEHPIHLHGMWMVLENGQGANQPLLHTVSVKPAERLSVAITADAPGQWVMHCHLLLHMELGMLRVIEVSPASEVKS
jgi:CopA family copper-resistance protein